MFPPLEAHFFRTVTFNLIPTMKRNNRSETLADTPEQLLETLRQLVAETEQLLSDASGPAMDKVEDIRSRISDASESLQEFYGSARQRLIAGARRTDETIREHPYESLAVSLGLGLLLGVLLRRSK
ncbi:MAG TPA: hypothetical protein VFB27_06020 [Opitutaceae bacterium]|nr:hypothetical protein [Opitutaceae bacterium]